jgi:hypothetical protein
VLEKIRRKIYVPEGEEIVTCFYSSTNDIRVIECRRMR